VSSQMFQTDNVTGNFNTRTKEPGYVLAVCYYYLLLLLLLLLLKKLELFLTVVINTSHRPSIH
jgi:hypothetical protein